MSPTSQTAARRKNRRQSIWDKDSGCCWLCGLPVSLEDMTIDHEIPRSKGGTSALKNLRASHSRCNNSRSNTYPVVLPWAPPFPHLPAPPRPKSKAKGPRPRGPVMSDITNENTKPLTTDERISLQKQDEEAKRH